jgi:NADH-quinone oxidoreductase subunit M
LTPLLGAFCILRAKEDVPNADNIKSAAVWSALSALMLTTSLLVFSYNSANPGQDYGHRYLHLHLEVGRFSAYFMEVTAFLTLLATLLAKSEINCQIKKFAIMTLLLEALSMILFSAETVFIFSIAFLGIVFVLYCLLGTFATTTTASSTDHGFFSLFLGAVLMLCSCIYITASTGISEIRILAEHPISPLMAHAFFAMFFIGMCSMLGLFPLHSWIFDAYAIAPRSIALLLNGVSSLAGGYGISYVLLPITKSICGHNYDYAIYFLLISMSYSSLSAVIQQDLRSILPRVAACYAAFSVIGILSGDTNGFAGGVYNILASGVIIALPLGVLCAARKTAAKSKDNTTNEAEVVCNIRYLPTVAMASLLMLVATPPSPLFNGGFFIAIGLLRNHLLLCVWLCSLMIGGSFFIIRRFWKIFSNGNGGGHKKKEMTIAIGELTYLLPAMLFVLLVGIFPQIIMNPMHCFGLPSQFLDKRFATGGLWE